MTSDFSFMPTVLQNPPPSIQCDNPGSFSTGSWSKTNASDLSKENKSDNFLNMLKKVSQNPNASDEPQRPSLNPNDETAVSNQISIPADIEELIDQLEALGWVAPAGETTMPAGGWAGDQNLSGPADNRQSGLWALKQLIIGIQANDNMPSNDMPAGWERLRLFISNALGGETTAQSGGDSKGDLNLNQTAGSAQLAHGAQEIAQTQTSPKAFEMATAAKETEAGQSALRNQTMEQIVRRAVVQVRGDGQHEARIDLKPEFLGHVRMQVITKNQQVTVKILTEFGFVKDMIENNIHQLKADLQQHGLEVDKVDVSVSRDADGNKHSQQNADRAKTRQHETDNTGGDNTREKNQEPKERAGLTADGLSTVDYFA
jgi:hypothetical protein